MFDNWKERLAEKKAKNKAFERAQWWKKNALLQEFLQAMRGSCTMASPQMHEAVVTAANIAIGEDNWTTVAELGDIPEDFLSGMVYIVWDEDTLPVPKAPWPLVSENLDHVLPVAANTLIVAETMDRIIWFNGHGRIMLYSIA